MTVLLLYVSFNCVVATALLKMTSYSYAEYCWTHYGRAPYRGRLWSITLSFALFLPIVFMVMWIMDPRT